jgi:medium-chain acyl-[acyl-carrier-protein] hydrolase
MTVTSTKSPWLPRMRPSSPARVRLFCFSHAGGGASVYRSWPGELPSEIDACAVQLPGREERIREPPLTSVDVAAREVALALLPHLDRPYAVFGHSLGALVGFEVARELRRRGFPPEHIFAAARGAPDDPSSLPPIHALPDKTFIEELQRRYKSIPAAVLAEPELLDLFVPLLRADLRMLESYRYVEGEPFACPITVLGGVDDHAWSEDRLAAWGRHTKGDFLVRMLPGDHFFLNPGRAEVLRIVSSRLVR